MRIIRHENYVSRRKDFKTDIGNFYGFVYFFEMTGKLHLCLVYEYGKIVAVLKDKADQTLGSKKAEICMDWTVSGFLDEVLPKNGNDRSCGTVTNTTIKNVDSCYPSVFMYAVNRDQPASLKMMLNYVDSVFKGKSLDFKN